MDIDSHTVNKAIKEILDALIAELPQYRWESICTYSDGIGRTLIEINVYSAGGSKKNGRLTYQLETGEVVNHRYAGLGTSPSESVLDMVLDIANLERGRQAS